MRYFEQIFKNIPNYKKLLFYKYQLFLLVLTLIGLTIKFIYLLLGFQNQSDTVFGGLAAIEFWNNNNFILSGYYVPSDDSNFFEVVVFHLVPQLIADYNPIMLKVSTFLIFALIVLTFSYFVYRLTDSILNGLFFSAVLSNWFIDYNIGVGSFVWITSHDSTILMIGVLLILYFFKPLKYWEILFFGILAAITFSDSLVLIWFIIPLIFVIICNHLKSQSIKEQIISFFKFDFIFKIVALSVILMIIKKFFISYYVEHTHIFHNLGIINLVTVQVTILFQHLSLLINPNFSRVFTNPGSISLIDIIFILLFVSYIVLLINYLKNYSTENFRTFYFFTGAAFLASSFFYITTAFAVQLQYLKFLLVSLLVIFCLVDFRKLKFANFFLIGIILINIFFCISVTVPLASADPPNEKQYNLIDFLKGANLSYGYGDYWDANIVTYLSHGDVTIRPIWVDSGLVPRYWNSADWWYKTIPQKYFVILDISDKSAIDYFNNTFQPKYSQELDYQNYKIFVYDQRGTNYQTFNASAPYEPKYQKYVNFFSRVLAQFH